MQTSKVCKFSQETYLSAGINYLKKILVKESVIKTESKECGLSVFGCFYANLTLAKVI